MWRAACTGCTRTGSCISVSPRLCPSVSSFALRLALLSCLGSGRRRITNCKPTLCCPPEVSTGSFNLTQKGRFNRLKSHVLLTVLQSLVNPQT